MILKCQSKTGCKATSASKFQDAKYGSMMRIHTPVVTNNTGKGGKKLFDYRCTVCSTQRGPSPEMLKKMKETEDKEKKK